MKSKILSFALLVSIIAMEASAKKIPVVASFSILAQLANEIGGDLVDVQSLVPPESEVHDFELRSHHLTMLRDAKLIVVNGLGLDNWTDKAILSSGSKGEKLVLTEGAPLLLQDPHCWQDLKCGQHYSQKIADALVRLHPSGKAEIMSRLQKFNVRATAVEERAVQLLTPFKGQSLLVPHEALQYLARFSGLQIISLRGLNRNIEESAKRRAAVLRKIKELKVKVALVENGHSDRSFEQVAADANVRLSEPLFMDTLARSGPASTYLGMMEQNANMIAQALKNSASDAQ